MHAAATPAADARGLAHELMEKSRHRQALCQSMAMAAVGRGDGVRAGERRHDAGTHSFLPDTQMDKAGNGTFGK